MYKKFVYLFLFAIYMHSGYSARAAGLSQADILSLVKFSDSLKDVSVQWALRDLPAVQAQKEIFLDVQSKIEIIEHAALDLDDQAKKVLWRILIYAAVNDYSDVYKVVVGKLARTNGAGDLSINFNYKRPKGWGQMEITPYSIAAQYKAQKILTFIAEEKWREAAQKKMAPLSQDKRLSLEKEFFSKDSKRKKKGIRIGDLLYAISFDIYNNIPDRSIVLALLDIPEFASNKDLLLVSPINKIDDKSKKIFWGLLIWAAENDYVELFRAVVGRVAANFDEKRPEGWGKVAITPRSVAQFHKAKKILAYIAQSEKGIDQVVQPLPKSVQTPAVPVTIKRVKSSDKQVKKVVRKRKGDRADRTAASEKRVAQHKADLKAHAKEKLEKAYASPMTESVTIKDDQDSAED